MFPINYLPLTVRHESIRTRSDNPDQMTLNKRSIVLYGHYLSVPKVTIKYKFDCNLYFQPKDKICLYYSDLTLYLWHTLFKIFFTIFYLTIYICFIGLFMLFLRLGRSCNSGIFSFFLFLLHIFLITNFYLTIYICFIGLFMLFLRLGGSCNSGIFSFFTRLATSCNFFDNNPVSDKVPRV
jgi:hypothetical protein